MFALEAVLKKILQPGLVNSYYLRANAVKQLIAVDSTLPYQFLFFRVQTLDVQPLLEAGLLSSLVIVLYRLLYSADSASSIMANDTIGNTRVTDGGEDENRRVVVRL